MPRSFAWFVLAGTLVACASNEAAPPIAPVVLTQAGCREWVGQPIERACVPREAREGAKLALDVAGSSGGCGTSVDRCTVRVDGRTITLSLDGRTCTAEATCTPSQPRVACVIPALEAGKYVVRYEDGSGRTSVLDVVPDASAATSCRL